MPRGQERSVKAGGVKKGIFINPKIKSRNTKNVCPDNSFSSRSFSRRNGCCRCRDFIQPLTYPLKGLLFGLTNEEYEKLLAEMKEEGEKRPTPAIPCHPRMQ